jgi:hypothetical protein
MGIKRILQYRTLNKKFIDKISFRISPNFKIICHEKFLKIKT